VSAIIVKLGIIGFLLLVVYFGMYLVNKTMDIPTAAMEWPWGLVYLAAPVGSIFMIVTSALQIADDFRRLGRDHGTK
jgi:TRAP-type C4-dicarboxylate transport system permease small subunit